MLDKNPKLLTIKDLSKLLNVSTKSIYQNYTKWQIPYVKIGGALRFNKQDIYTWLESKKQ